MKTERENLEKELNIILSIYNAHHNASGKVKEEVVKKMAQHGITPGEVYDIFSKRIPLQTVTLPMLCLLTMYLYETGIEEAERIKPDKYFTEFEITEAKKFYKEKENQNKYPIVFENVMKFDEDYFVTKISIQTLNSLISKAVLTYNPETQRPLLSKAYGDRIIQEIDINLKSVRDIKNNILQGKQIPDFITFNLLQNGNDNFEYDADNKTLTIYSGELDMADGFHRIMGALQAYRENPNIDFYYGLIITNWDVSKTLRYIHQEDLKNKLKKSFKKAINPDKFSNLIVKKINENTDSYLRGLITTDKEIIRANKAVIMFDVLSDAIDILFKPSENVNVVKYSKWLIDGFNYIIEEKPDLLKETEQLLWIAYTIILKEYYETDNWQEKVKFAISKINKKDLEDIRYRDINKILINKIKQKLIQRGVLLDV